MLDRDYLAEECVEEGGWIPKQPQRCFNLVRNVRQVKPTTEAYSSGDTFIQYFDGPGNVPFQDRLVSKVVFALNCTFVVQCKANVLWYQVNKHHG
ncbi:hypothetical protein PR048_012326 [Dryococelus australis]|uniref:Uncharacterized protein n=1 Tax=Dryococelus australis TaxID=614101 RepID=A0ABQ9HPE5_9NEOP|nr:hypothetical protein PR048_012326 [Dryococelus australis]